MERLGASYFPMFENLSAIEGQRSRNLTKRRLDQLVTESDFMPSSDLQYGFAQTHDMIDEIRIACQVAWRELALRLELMEHDPDFVGDYNSIAADCQLDLGIGLRHCAKLNVMKIMGAMCHPLFQQKVYGCKQPVH